MNMSYTVFGVFESHSAAIRTREELMAAGFSAAEVRLQVCIPPDVTSNDLSISNVMSSHRKGGIKEFFKSFVEMGDDEEAERNSEAVQRGHYYLVKVDTNDEAKLQRAGEILQRYGLVNLDEYLMQWKRAASSNSARNASSFSSKDIEHEGTIRTVPLDPVSMDEDSASDASSMAEPDTTATDNTSFGANVTTVSPMPVKQEEPQLHKQGGVWVLTRVVDDPLEQTTILRKDHIFIERRASDGPATEADFAATQGNTLGMRETTEEPVVSESTHIVEYREVSKPVIQQDATVHGTIRHMDVQVDPLDAERIQVADATRTPENETLPRAQPDLFKPVFRGARRGRASTDRHDAAVPLPAAVRKPAALVVCHFLAEMDQQVLLNRTTTIEVIISRELVDSTPGLESTQAAGEIDPTSKLLVQIVPKSNFVLGEAQADRAEIDPPLANKPKSVYFNVKGAHLGQGEIWIIVRQRQTGIVRLVLESEVLDRVDAARKYRAKAEATATEAPILRSPLDQLLVIEQTIGDKIQYMFELDMPSINVFEHHTSKPLQIKREEYVKALYREIEDRYLSHYSEATRTADIEAFTAELQAYGVLLFEQLFPQEVQAQLWKHHTKLKNIRVVSTEPFIPWEIVHLKAPGEPLDPDAPSLFLGQMGLLRWLHNVNGHPPVQLRIRDKRARYVIPNYPHPDWVLPDTAKERAFLEAKFAATAVEPQPNEVRTLLSQAGAFDLLHFACHGEADQDNSGNARIVLEGRVEGTNYIPTRFDASTVEAFARLRGQDGTQPIVFLNACQAGRAGYKLTGIGGFAQAFLRAGAGAFIGTLWSVGDEPAFCFGKVFYEALLNGQTVPQATTAARAAARQAGDATWLAYVVYAHPHATLQRTELAS